MGNYHLWKGPEYRAASPAEIMMSALDQPLSLFATMEESAKNGVLESYGLGTALRGLTTPEGNEPQTIGGAIRDTIVGMTVVPVPGAYPLLKRGAQAIINPDQPSMTEDAYKASPHYRDGIPWDEGMTEARAAALADAFDLRKAREFYAAKRPITAFLGNLAGQSLDPVNYIPIGGPLVRAAAVGRAGRIAGEAITSAIDAATNTALFAGLTAGERGRYGDDVSWQATVSQIATAALIGSAFGGISGALDARSVAKARGDAEIRLNTLRATQEARLALNEAIDGLARDGAVNLGPNSTGVIRSAAEHEAARIAAAYDQVRAEPTGPVNDPLVEIVPDNIEGTILARGAFKDVNQIEFSRRGWGLVKMVWKHGGESGVPEAYQVRKEDIVAFPDVIRSFKPANISPDGGRREWRVERNGRTVVYADTLFGSDGRHLVTAYIQEPGRPGADRPLSEAVPRPIPSGVATTLEDTAGGLSTGGPGEGGGMPATTNIAPRAAIDNSRGATEVASPERQAAEARAAKADNYKAMAEQYRVDPDTGDFPEMAEIERLREAGQVNDEDLAALDDAQATVDAANAYAEALKAVVGCLL